MIRFQQVSLMRGIKPLLDRADVTFNPGEKIGLIGPNGAGKSSVLSLLRGELHVDQGDIDFPAQWNIAHVAQETPALERPAIEYALDGDTTLRRLETQLADLENSASSTENGTLMAEVHTQLADADAYTARSRAEQLLIGLGFTQAQMNQSVAHFSGGWRMRLNLAQALMCPSDLLLLDEPTNHLDLDAILWLEEWLKRYTGTLIIISHDRDFLDGVVQVIVHMDEQKLKRYAGNYTDFERQRAAQLELAAGMLEKQRRTRAHLQSFIDRFRAKATKARQAQSRMKALAKMEALAPLRAAAEFSFEFREPHRAPNPLLVMEKAQLGYGAQGEPTTILSNIDFSLQTGQRIGLLGMNGAGKSTFIKTIAAELPLLSGQIHFGKGLSLGYFAQHQLDMLRHDESPLWHLMKIAPTTREQELRNFLGSFNFNGTMATHAIAPFSGGEKARLALALIVWQRPNLLLLDEPTNHLDLETREALTMALAQFEGTLVLVSHDRHLLRATTDELIIVADGQVQPFEGDLDDYKTWLFQTKLASKNEAKATSKTLQKTRQTSQTLKSTASKKNIEARIQRLEAQIAQCTAQNAALESRLADPALYDPANKENLTTALRERAECEKTLEALETQWLQAQEDLSPT